LRCPENGTACEEIKRVGGVTGVGWNAHTQHGQDCANTHHCQPDTKQSGNTEILDNFKPLLN
jgi:hypothetical protein